MDNINYNFAYFNGLESNIIKAITLYDQALSYDGDQDKETNSPNSL